MITAPVRPAFLLILLAGLSIAQAPPEAIAKIIDEGSAEKGQVMKHLDHLTNTIGPRLTGSDRLTQAVEWARDKFKSFGIENARIEQWGEIEVGFNRGKHAGFMTLTENGAPVRTAVVFGTNAWTAGTEGMKVGPAVLTPETDEAVADFASKIKDAWVVTTSKSKIKSKDLRETCTASGAFGVVSNGGELIITSGNHRTKWDKIPTLPSVNLHKDEFEKLVEKLRAGEKATLEFDIQNHFKKGPIPVYDVIAEIRGTEKPDEMVIVGGHIDSWDGATGTTDNGTGTVTTIEAARLLMAAGAKPKRTIRFMLWSGEEEGLLGSAAYAAKHPEELAKISAVLVHDGGTNYVSGIGGTKDMIPLFETVFAPVKTLDPAMPFKIREVGALPLGIGSDHDTYVQKGVPGFFWGQAGKANYTHTHHTQYDTFDAAIPEYERHTSKVVAIGALGIANLDVMLPRAKSERPAAAQIGRRRLGIQLDGDTMTISEVTEDGRAAKMGLKEGDILLKVDGTPIADRNALSEALNAGSPDKKLVVKRGGKEVEFAMSFAPAESRPASQPAK